MKNLLGVLHQRGARSPTYQKGSMLPLFFSFKPDLAAKCWWTLEKWQCFWKQNPCYSKRARALPNSSSKPPQPDSVNGYCPCLTLKQSTSFRKWQSLCDSSEQDSHILSREVLLHTSSSLVLLGDMGGETYPEYRQWEERLKQCSIFLKLKKKKHIHELMCIYACMCPCLLIGIRESTHRHTPTLKLGTTWTTSIYRSHYSPATGVCNQTQSSDLTESACACIC